MSYFEQRIAEVQAEVMGRFATYTPPPPVKPKPVRKGYVYFFRAGNTVKIGFSTNLRERASKLQTSCPERAFMARFVKGTHRTERQLHERFAEYRLTGEWFDIRGRLAKYLERHIRPVEFPDAVAQEPEPEIEIRL